MDHFLNTTTTELPSFVKNTTYFLQLLENMGPLSPKLLACNPRSHHLYTNINHPTRLEAATEALNQSRPRPDVKPSNKSLINLLKLVLTKTNFQFNGQNFLQISGTAMGTRVVHSFAIHTMGAF